MFVSRFRMIAGISLAILNLAAVPASAQTPNKPQPAKTARPSEQKPAGPAATPAAAEAQSGEAKPAPRADAKGKDSGNSAFWKPTKEAIAAEREQASKRDVVESIEGISDSSETVGPLLAQHPDSAVVICLAGCGPQPTIVQVVANADVVNLGDQGEMEQNSTSAGTPPPAGAVICIAGCQGKRGEVIFKNARLAWLSDDQGREMKAAIRAIADRLAANEQLSVTELRSFVSATARAALTGDAAVASAHLPRGTLD